MTSEDTAQATVTSWFDATYAKKAFGYLRPLEAYPIFVQLLGARAGESLLDVACGPGHLLRAAELRGLRPTGVDISAKALELARQYVPSAELRESNAEELPFADATFDHVTCVGAIERFLDRPRALGEMCRVGKGSARFLFMVRNSRTLDWLIWKRWLGQQNRDGHQDALTLEDWCALMGRCGLEVEAVYMDQWLRQRLRKALRGFRARDLTQDEPVAEPLLPIRFANEFILLCRKA